MKYIITLQNGGNRRANTTNTVRQSNAQ